MTSEDQWQLAERNLRAEAASLRARVRKVEARLAVPAGGRAGCAAHSRPWLSGMARPSAPRCSGPVLAVVERRLATGRISVVRGGRGLLAEVGDLAAAGLDEARWREQWQAARLFLVADGEKDKAFGNETIRWHPDEGWVEVKLPAPLAWGTGRMAGTACRAPLPSLTGAMRSPPRRPPAQSAMTSPTTRSGPAGTWTQAGARPRSPSRRWKNCAGTRWWPWT